MLIVSLPLALEHNTVHAEEKGSCGVGLYVLLVGVHTLCHTCKIKIKRKESVQKQDSVLRLPSRPLYTSRSDSEDVAGKQDVHDRKQIIHDGKRRIRPSSLAFSLSEVFCTVRKSIDASRTAHSVLCKCAQSFVTPPSRVLLETLRTNCACRAQKSIVQRYCKRAFSTIVDTLHVGLPIFKSYFGYTPRGV